MKGGISVVLVSFGIDECKCKQLLYGFGCKVNASEYEREKEMRNFFAVLVSYFGIVLDLNQHMDFACFACQKR